MKSFKTIKEILDNFPNFSGLQVNNSKSHIVFSKWVHDISLLASILGFKLQQLPIKYLGTPITGKSISHKDCTTLIAELQALLEKWNHRFVSYKGRTQLVHWIFHGKFG